MADLDSIVADIKQWHRTTIAPHVTTQGSWAKVVEEFEELAEAVAALDHADLFTIPDPEYRILVENWKKEMMDLLVSVICYADFSLVALEPNLRETVERLKARTWTMGENGAMHHD